MCQINEADAFSSIKSRYALALALRDFFAAGSCQEIESALRRLPGMPRLDASALRELEYEFNHLFTGPAAPVAPPYASVYLEKEPTLMGSSTIDVARFYKALGLMEPTGGVPPDFLPLELEAWAALISLADGEECAAQARRYWIGHLDSWLPLFIKSMRRERLSEAMAGVAALLEAWLAGEREIVWKEYREERF